MTTMKMTKQEAEWLVEERKRRALWDDENKAIKRWRDLRDYAHAGALPRKSSWLTWSTNNYARHNYLQIYHRDAEYSYVFQVGRIAKDALDVVRCGESLLLAAQQRLKSFEEWATKYKAISTVTVALGRYPRGWEACIDGEMDFPFSSQIARMDDDCSSPAYISSDFIGYPEKPAFWQELDDRPAVDLLRIVDIDNTDCERFQSIPDTTDAGTTRFFAMSNSSSQLNKANQ